MKQFGPWSAKSPKNDSNVYDIYNEHDIIIAKGLWGHMPEMRLMSMAPEMLETLESALALLINSNFSPFLDGPLINLRDEIKSVLRNSKGEL